MTKMDAHYRMNHRNVKGITCDLVHLLLTFIMCVLVEVYVYRLVYEHYDMFELGANTYAGLFFVIAASMM